jgi:hypothetical protein
MCPSNRDSISGSDKICVFIWRVRTVFGAQPTSYFVGTGNCFSESKAIGSMKMTEHTHLVPGESISGAEPPRFFIMCTGTSSVPFRAL